MSSWHEKGRKRFFVFRRFRGSWFRWEWHNHGGVIFLMLSIAHPRRHAWWATMIYFYPKGG